MTPRFIESRGWWLHRSAVDQITEPAARYLRRLEDGIYPRGYQEPKLREPYLPDAGVRTLDVAFRRASRVYGLRPMAMPTDATLSWLDDGRCWLQDMVLNCGAGPLTVPSRFTPLLQLGAIMDAGSADFVGVFDRTTQRLIAIVATAEMREPAWLRARQEVAA